MTILPRPAPAQNNLVDALTARFVSDPKLINEVVTGACTWPAEQNLEWLHSEAVDWLDDVRDWPDGIRRFQSIQGDMIRAAVDALAEMIADAEEKRRLDDEAYEERSGYIPEHHGWQGLFR